MGEWFAKTAGLIIIGYILAVAVCSASVYSTRPSDEAKEEVQFNRSIELKRLDIQAYGIRSRSITEIEKSKSYSKAKNVKVLITN